VRRRRPLSWRPATVPDAGPAPSCDQAVIVPRARDLGGFEVRRVLPSARQRTVGRFSFLDQMGPVEFLTGKAVDVRPHPH
jgi:redox-sensitive bicupin YhaK (pirin superfamily)